MKTITNRINTLKDLKIEKERLNRKELFLRQRIRESVNFDFREDTQGLLSQVPDTLRNNPMAALRMTTSVLPHGMLRNILMALSKYSAFIKIAYKAFKNRA